MKEINETNFSDFVLQPLAVIAFSSPWCSSCKKIISFLPSLADQLEGRVAFGACDVSENPALASSLKIFSVPAMVIFKDGSPARTLMGPIKESALLDILKENS